MPFDFGIDLGSFDFGADSFLPSDLGSLVDSFGTEFLDTSQFTEFNVSFDSISDLGGYEQVGSFAGDSGWYDAFGTQGILEAAQDVDVDAFFESTREAAAEAYDLSVAATEWDVIQSLPVGEQVITIAKTVASDFASFAQQIQPFLPLINATSSALGVQNPIGQVLAPVSQAVGIAGAAAGVAGAASTGNTQAALTNPALVSTVYSLAGGSTTQLGQTIGTGVSLYNYANAVGSTLPPVQSAAGVSAPTGYTVVGAVSQPTVDQAGSVVATNGIVGGTFRELSAEETLALERRNLNPILVNSFTDPGTGQPLNYDTAVQSSNTLTPLVAEATNNIAIAQQNIASNNANIAAIEAELRDENLPDDRRELLEEYLQANYENNSIQQYTITSNQQILASAGPNLAADQAVIATTNNSVINTATPVATPTAFPQYTSAYDPETGTWSVYNNTTSTTVQTGLTEQQAILAEQDLNIGTGVTLNSTPTAVNLGTATANDVALNLDPGLFSEGATVTNLVAAARAQQSVSAIRNNKAQSSDWRVRLRLAPNSTYLYNAPGNPGDPASGPGIMSPLRDTDGVIFPYTPSIDTAYKANYEAYDLTHSNYRGYFYKGSYVDAVNIRAQFTAQDTNEANYLLAVIHFFRSATKMFYGQDQQLGSPPPLVYLSGYGDYQFNEHPSVISQFNYTLPPDVDYIRAQNALDVNTNLLSNRLRNPIANNPLAYTVNRLLNSGLLPGALDFRPNVATNLPIGSPTYVPTKMEISITLLPIQSRQQVSKNFSLKSFAAGNLLKGGFW